MQAEICSIEQPDILLYFLRSLLVSGQRSRCLPRRSRRKLQNTTSWEKPLEAVSRFIVESYNLYLAWVNLSFSLAYLQSTFNSRCSGNCEHWKRAEVIVFRDVFFKSKRTKFGLYISHKKLHKYVAVVLNSLLKLLWFFGLKRPNIVLFWYFQSCPWCTITLTEFYYYYSEWISQKASLIEMS